MTRICHIFFVSAKDERQNSLILLHKRVYPTTKPDPKLDVGKLWAQAEASMPISSTLHLTELSNTITS